MSDAQAIEIVCQVAQANARSYPAETEILEAVARVRALLKPREKDHAKQASEEP